MKYFLSFLLCVAFLATQTLFSPSLSFAYGEQFDDDCISHGGVIDDISDLFEHHAPVPKNPETDLTYSTNRLLSSYGIGENSKTDIHVSFYDINWESIEGGEITVGGNTIPSEAVPDAPEIQGYEFVGWNKDIYATYPNGTDLKIYALYRQYGDVNYDGNVSYEDISILRQYMVDDEAYLDDEALYFGDCNHDGELNWMDIEQISMIASDIDTRLICDANSDRKINTSDAVVLLRLSAGMTEYPDVQSRRFWDANFDKRLNTSDATAILNYIVKHQSYFGL